MTPARELPRDDMGAPGMAVDPRRVTPERPGSGPSPGVGNSFAGYQLEEVIGAGGMGTVYRARKLATGERVAVKVMRSTLSTGEERRRFYREQRILKEMSHENIVRLLDTVEEGGVPAIVMEYVEGKNLRQWLEDAPRDLGECLRIVAYTLRAIAYAHDCGVTHRDIKPENILIAANGDIKLVDFGLARPAVPSEYLLTRSDQQLGTPNYVAPEQWADPRSAGASADLWSVGFVMYEILTGEPPVGVWQKISTLNPACPKAVDGILYRSLQRNPSRRYQTAQEMLRDVLQAAPTRSSAKGSRLPASERAALRRPTDGHPAAIRPSAVPESSVVVSDLLRPQPKSPPRPEPQAPWSTVLTTRPKPKVLAQGVRPSDVVHPYWEPRRGRLDEVECWIVLFLLLDVLMVAYLILRALRAV